MGRLHLAIIGVGLIGGSLGPRDAKKGPHADSWYARLLPLFTDDALDDALDDAI